MIGIASWNLRNLSHKRSEESLKMIADIILKNEIDLIAMQEIRDNEVIKKLADLTKFNFVVSEAVGSALTHAHQTGRRKEHYAFMWNKNVEIIGHPEIIIADHVFVRPPFCGFFRAAKFDFVLATIHVVWGKIADRRLENDNIDEVIHKVFERCASHGGERDVILCGDFNMPPEKIKVHDWTPLFTTGGRYPETDKTIVGDTNLYDQIWINRKYTKEYNNKCEIVKFDEKFGSREEAVKEVSDHRPVIAWFNTSVDDNTCAELDLGGININ